MNRYGCDIFDLYSTTLKKSLEAFCSEINNSNADVFVIMAHKAVKLFQILLDQNHLSNNIANKIIISNHALDFDSSYLAGKKIAIIDDILISGTSIASTIHKLLKLGISQDNISVIILAINKQYQNISFNTIVGKNMLHCNWILNDADCIELSSDISKIFSYYGIPYDIDFPNYNAIELKNNRINLLFNELLWETNKISNEEHNAGNIDAYTLFPNECVRNMLWEYIGVNLEQSIHLKLRVYVKNYPCEKQDCYIIPMCFFNEICETDLEILYNFFNCEKSEIRLQNNAFVAKMRYLQFYIAHQLYLVFKRITSLDCDTVPSKTSIIQLFGADDGTKVSNGLDVPHYNCEKIVQLKNATFFNNIIIDEYLNSDTGKNIKADIYEFKQRYSSLHECLINRIIFMPFLWWYDTKEITVRKELLNTPVHYIKDYTEIESKLKRLNSGFSLRALERILENILGKCEFKHLVSIFIDRAIDEGIIVPTITHNEDAHYLSRVYRHGEDLPFALQDECRLLHFLCCLSDRISGISVNSDKLDGVVGIATISFEKIIVLFYQMGLEQGNIFNRFLGFDNIKLLKPFLSIHGKVEAIVDPKEIKKQNITEHFYSESLEGGDRYITWLTKWMLKKNFIKRKSFVGSGKHNRIVYVINRNQICDYLQRNERSCISDVVLEDISNLASMIATWYNTTVKSEGKDVFKEDAIALTSCSNIYTFASAIATEIHYFSMFWKSQVKKAFGVYDNVNAMIATLTETEEDEKQMLNTEQALYSGRNKTYFFYSEKALSVIQKVSKFFEKAVLAFGQKFGVP